MKVVLRDGVQIVGTLPSGASDNILTTDSTSIGSISAIDSSNFLTTTLANGKIIVGNGSNVATAVTASGDATISNAGVIAIAGGVIVNADINASAAIDASKIANGTVSSTEFQYLDGVTSAIQTQLNAKANLASPTFTGTTTVAQLVDSGLTANTVPYANGSKQLTSSAVTPTELGYVSGVTSSIQSQFTGKLSATITSAADGDIIYRNAGVWVNLARGSVGQVLTATGGSIQWASGASNGLPAGGSANQYLNKIDGTNYNAQWSTLTLSKITDVTSSVAEVNILDGATLTTSELNYVDGVTSAIQTQIDNKLANSLSQNNIWYGNASNQPTPLSPGANGYVLTSSSGVPTWAAASTSFALITDTNGNEEIIFTATGSAINEFTIANAAASGRPTLSVTGGDTDISMAFSTKGAGIYRFTTGGNGVLFLTVGTNTDLTFSVNESGAGNGGFAFQAEGSGVYKFKGTSTQAAQIRLYEDTDDGSNYTALKVGTQAGDITYTLPTAAPASNGYSLTATTAGVMSWVAAITNTSVANEFMLSDGTNATPSGVFKGVALGDIQFGSGSLSGSERILSVAGSASNIDLYFVPKGSGLTRLFGNNLIMYNGVTIGSSTAILSFQVGSNNSTIECQAQSGSPGDLDIKASAGISGGTTGGGLFLVGGAGYASGNTAGGLVDIASGAPNAAGAEGAVNIQTRSAGKLGFFNTTAVVKQTSGANLTNNVTSGGTNDQIDNFTSLTVYATDAAAIRNDIYQLARKLKQINDGLRTYGIFT